MLIIVMAVFAAALCMYVFLALNLNLERTQESVGVRFAMFDDSDIKIATDRPSEQILKSKEEPQEDIAKLLHIQRENGNLDKARELGRRVATDICRFCPTGDQCSDEIVLEMKTLSAFVVDESLNNLLPNSIVSQTASNEYMVALKEIDEEFYDHIQIAGSYSIYVLHSRQSSGNLEKQIGDSFAKFIGHEGDEKWAEKGAHLYSFWLKDVKDRIKSYNFID